MTHKQSKKDSSGLTSLLDEEKWSEHSRWGVRLKLQRMAGLQAHTALQRNGN